MKPSVLVIVPLPAGVTVREKLSWVNVAPTDCAWVMVTTQEPVPVQAPVQPVKLQPCAGAAFSVTCVLLR